MHDLAICVCASDGCAIIVRNGEGENRAAPTFFDNNDHLLRKVVPTKLKFPNAVRECEVKSLANNNQIAIVVSGTAEDRLKVFAAITDESRSYLLSHYKIMPIACLADRIGSIFQKLTCSAQTTEAVVASWNEEDGSEIFCVRADGERYKCHACVIGEDCNGTIRMNLENFDFRGFTTKQAIAENVSFLERVYGKSELKITFMSRETNGAPQKFI